MIRLKHIFAFAIAASLALFALPPAQAAQSVLCAAQLADTAAARTIKNPNTGTTYILNGQGCTIAAQADIGWFLSQGFTAGPPFGPNLIFTTGALPASGTTAINIGALPPGTYIQHIIVQNTTGNAVTGGLAFGTTANGTDIVAALASAGNSLAFVADAALLKRIFSTTAAQTIFMSPVTSSNSANLTVTLVYGYF